MNVAENIVNIRKEKGFSQWIIADALHVDIAVVSNIERGKRELRVNELEKIANALAVDVLYLLTYPHVYVKKEPQNNDNQADAIIQIRLSGDKRDKVLRLLFGDADLEFMK